MKKWLAFILAVCMLLTAVPAMAYGYDGSYEYGAATYAQSGWIGDGMYLAQTPLYGSSMNKIENIWLASEALHGTAVYYGDTFSFNEEVGPRTKEDGYLNARNGRGVNVLGGGVSQLATTLYLALRDAFDVTIDPFMSYDKEFADWYVEDGSDAVVTDYKNGHDFTFTSWYEGVIYIESWMDEDYVYCLVSFEEEGSRDVRLARASTPIFGSDNKQWNIDMAADAVSSFVMEFGDHFSFNELVGPRTQEAGFRYAENGRGVKVYGGGVAQVASTIYLAVKEQDYIEMDEFRTYGDRFVDGYVADINDAIVTDYNAGFDFGFTYWGYESVMLLVYRDGDRLVCELYEF